MTAHKHADSMRQYAEDAATTETPWELWECRSAGGPWVTYEAPGPSWHSDYEYRRKPHTLTVEVPWFPEPERKTPGGGAVYYIPNANGSVSFLPWVADAVDVMALNTGLVHLTREAAEQHAAAILALNKMERTEK